MIIATILRIFDTTLSALAALLLIEYEGSFESKNQTFHKR